MCGEVENFYHQTTFMIVNKQLAKKLLKSTELGRSYSPPKLARFFEPQCSYFIVGLFVSCAKLYYAAYASLANHIYMP